MSKSLALWLAVLALALLLPTQIYGQSNTTVPTATGQMTNTTGASASSLSSATSSTRNTTSPGHGNLLHASTSLLVIVVSASLLQLC